jgi:putative ABC transport system ATP-binding protein
MIDIRNLTKTFKSGRGEVKALQGITLAAERGTTLAVVGKSGSGKTTLLNCIGGLDSPDGGTIVCFGKSLTTLSPKHINRFQRKQVGFVFQHANLLSYLTVAENIELPLVLNGLSGKEKAARISGLLEKIGLSDAGGALPQELSGGELQRVSFARAIAHRPSLLLADEPTASLDSETGQKLVSLMVDLSREHHCTMVIATHDAELVTLADTTVSLRDGKMEERR